VIGELRQFVRETWDLIGGTVIACYLLGLILYWVGAVGLGQVVVGAPIVAIVVVFCGLWILALAGGSIPW
jgi:hypothetical protein